MTAFTPEQEKNLDARFKKFLTRVTVGYLLLLAGLGFGYVQQIKLLEKVDNSSKSQLINRASNVATWCESINEGREKIHSLVIIKYLPCKVLVAETYKSSNGKKTASLQSIEQGLKH